MKPDNHTLPTNSATPSSKDLAETAYIFEIQKLSTEDGPGIRTTVFLKGCPLRCAWCHNPESIDQKPSIQWFKSKCIKCQICVEACPQHAISIGEEGITIDREKCTACGTCVKECPTTAMKQFGERISFDQLWQEVLKDQAYYQKSGGGLTVSGGEPTMQPDVVERLFQQCQLHGIHTALDTCGLASKAIYARLLPLTDLILYDMKIFDSAAHREATGQPNEIILDNLKYVVDYCHEHQKDVWIRTPLIPGFTDSVENIQSIGRFIVEELHNHIGRWDVLGFNNLAKSKYERMNLPWLLAEAQIYTPTQLDALYQIAKATGANNVNVSGLTRTE